MSVFNHIIKESANAFNSIETLEEGVFNYKPSMIPVASRNTAEGQKYIVEFDMLQKLAGYENSSITEAFEAVCLENGIDAEDTFVYVSEGTCEIVEESAGSSMAANITRDINALHNNAVNMLRS